MLKFFYHIGYSHTKFLNAWSNELSHSIYLYKKAKLLQAFKTFVSWLYNSAIGVNNSLIQKLSMIISVLVKKLQHSNNLYKFRKITFCSEGCYRLLVNS